MTGQIRRHGSQRLAATYWCSLFDRAMIQKSRDQKVRSGVNTP